MSVMPEPVNGQTVLLEDRKKIEIDAVRDVSGFDEGAVLLRTSYGDMAVEGDGLHITRLDLEKGVLTVEGRINAIFFTAEPGDRKKNGLFRRLVK